MVRELFQMARSKKACLIFFDEVDAIGGARFDDGAGGDNEVQRTMLEIVNQLDGFDARGNVKVLMATNRPDTLDPALLRPGRLDRKVEFGLPDLESRTQIFQVGTAHSAVLGRGGGEGAGGQSRGIVVIEQSVVSDWCGWLMWLFVESCTQIFQVATVVLGLWECREACIADT
jgi:SpoVK/Ycf46/Vps4 family AAA+-type ATPase